MYFTLANTVKTIWIQKGLECLPNAEFVLDKHHKNKAIRAMTAGIENKYRNNYDKEIREALNEEILKLYEQLTDSLIMQNPDRAETISQNAAYLQRFVKGIGICKKDKRANNGGCTEPHISHVLATSLSSKTYPDCIVYSFSKGKYAAGSSESD